jgi:hypothetical protein
MFPSRNVKLLNFLKERRQGEPFLPNIIVYYCCIKGKSTKGSGYYYLPSSPLFTSLPFGPGLISKRAIPASSCFQHPKSLIYRGCWQMKTFAFEDIRHAEKRKKQDKRSTPSLKGRCRRAAKKSSSSERPGEKERPIPLVNESSNQQRQFPRLLDCAGNPTRAGPSAWASLPSPSLNPER